MCTTNSDIVLPFISLLLIASQSKSQSLLAVITMNEWMRVILDWGLLLGLGSFIAACWLLIPPILRPKVITYPWRLPDSHSYRDRDKKRTVVMAGSFNPPHLGHLAMLEYLSKRYVVGGVVSQTVESSPGITNDCIVDYWKASK